MDRSLWLLVKLRANGRARRALRKLRTLKGVLFALVGTLFFLPMIVSAFLMPRIQIVEQLELIRRFGPLGLFGYCVLSILLSSGERAIYYTQSEVNFLFCGPYRPRQLLLYKVAGNLGPLLFSTAFMTLMFRLHSALTIAAFIGLFLALEMMSLLSMAVSLFASTVGALAFNRQRKVLLVALAAIVVSALVPMGRELFSLTTPELLRRLETAPVVHVIVAPFRPFILAFTAERLWPDLFVGTALSLAVDLALLGLVLSLNVRFLEVSARVSTRLYEKLRRVRRGAAWAETGSTRVRLGMLPWWGGIGPNLWRQLITASRTTSRILAVWFLFILPLVLVLLISARTPQAREHVIIPALTLLGSLAVFAPTMVGYDFRPDLVRMEDLKTLPIRPASLVIGQLATPSLVITIGEWLGLAVIASQLEVPPIVALTTVVVAPPLTFLLVAIENLYSLWFPTRFVPGNTADFQMMGQQLLLMMARLFSAVCAGGIAAGLGAAAFFLGGESWPLAIVVAWLVLAAFGAGMIPLVAKAFLHFDVARDQVE